MSLLRGYPILRALHSRSEGGSHSDTVVYSWKKMFCRRACTSLLLLHFFALKACQSCPKVRCSLVLRILFQKLLTFITHITGTCWLLLRYCYKRLFWWIKWLVTGRLLRIIKKVTKINHFSNIVPAFWRISRLKSAKVLAYYCHRFLVSSRFLSVQIQQTAWYPREQVFVRAVSLYELVPRLDVSFKRAP